MNEEPRSDGKKEWISPDTLADWLKIPVGTIYRWRYQSNGPVGHRVGRHVRYRQSDVEHWLRGNRDGR